MMKECVTCFYNQDGFCVNAKVLADFTHIKDKDVYIETVQNSQNNKQCGVTGGYQLWQEKTANLVTDFLTKNASQSLSLQVALMTGSYCNIKVEKTEICNSETCNEHFLINRLSKQFESNNLTLPETSKSLKIKDSIIAKIPFYTFVICWILAIASLLK